ncbi:MAG: DUF2804 domain-containing protein [Oscillospiraceae bacterium]|nr:DUF2804 domain-containing protein [Oscillospiraceae bacterium]
MDIRGRFAKLFGGAKNAGPRQPEEYGREDYIPEDYGEGNYIPGEYDPEEYVGEDYLPAEDYPADETGGAYPPEGFYPEDEAGEAYPPEDFYPEDETGRDDVPEGIPSLEEPEAPEALEEEIPIEEFSLDELSEEEVPEPLPDASQPEAASPAGPEDWEMPEQEEELPDDEPLRRPRLLSKKGRLRHPGWAETDQYEYNKERIRHPARRKEWELYRLHNDRFSLFICYGHTGYMSLVEVTLLDFASGERFHAGKRQFFPGDSLDLDFSGGQPHSLKYEDGELFLSISFDGDLRRVQLRSAELEAEISCHDAGDAVVTAVPFESRSQFAYNYKKVFRDLFGSVNLHNRALELDTDTFMTLWSERGVWPYRYSTLWAAGAQETEDGVLALNLGGGYGRDDAPTENAVFVDGKIIKLDRVYFRFSSEDSKKPWRIVDRERRIKLTFRPAYEDVDERKWLLISTRSHQLFGRLSGRILLPDGTEREIRNMAFFCQYGVYRW